jgi:hypothetical protein
VRQGGYYSAHQTALPCGSHLGGSEHERPRSSWETQQIQSGGVDLSTKEHKIPGIQILPEYDPLFRKDGSLSTDRVSGPDEASQQLKVTQTKLGAHLDVSTWGGDASHAVKRNDSVPTRHQSVGCSMSYPACGSSDKHLHGFAINGSGAMLTVVFGGLGDCIDVICPRSAMWNTYAISLGQALEGSVLWLP